VPVSPRQAARGRGEERDAAAIGAAVPQLALERLRLVEEGLGCGEDAVHDLHRHAVAGALDEAAALEAIAERRDERLARRTAGVEGRDIEGRKRVRGRLSGRPPPCAAAGASRGQDVTVSRRSAAGGR
jgi:hypothetical protein